MTIEMPTVVFSHAISNTICLAVFAVLWFQNRRRFAGIGFWLACSLLQWVGGLLLVLRGQVPDFWSILVGNTLLIGSMLLLLIGLERFTGRRGRHGHNYLMLGIFVAAYAYFAFAAPSLTGRTVLFSAGLLVFSAQSAWLMLRPVREGPEALPPSAITRAIGTIFVALFLVNGLRTVFNLFAPAQTDFFHASLYDTLAVLIYQMLSIVLTFSLLLMVNQRLVDNLNQDIAARQRIEQTLRASEASFREVFDHIAHGIFIVEVGEDGQFRVGSSNQAEMDTAGVRRETIQGKTIAEILPPAMAEQACANYRRAVEAGQPIAYEEDVELPGRGRRYFMTSLSPVRDESGRFYRIIGSSLDITDRKRSEEKLRQSEETLRWSEEKFYKAFQATPDILMITRLSDGRIVEVNEVFCRLFGRTRADVLASTTAELGIWVDLKDRERVISELRAHQRIREWAIDFRAKSGRIIHGLYSGEIITLNDEPHFLSVTHDITEQKRTERVLHMRLDLWEYASLHPLEALMQRALDEIGELTGSSIGFYHIVEEDQNTVALKAWSTRTLTEFCASGELQTHYPIDQAGVWVDCVKQRKPVIHNDYAALPHRKGLPPGHAQLVRELIAPTLRDGKVVAVLGVGNKASDYDERDVELVSYISDMIWSIVEQKRTSEQVRLLNTRLEQMAMTDDLTGLENRRSFFKRGAEEIKRTSRYQTPLSLLMLDIDHFKRVNDTYGHDMGDLLLQCVARTLRSNMREVDIVARLGGEEFGILLPNTDAAEAVKLGERLRVAVGAALCARSEVHLTVTVSIGVAAYTPDTSGLDAMLRAADQAMYQAKALGRNRVVYLGGE